MDHAVRAGSIACVFRCIRPGGRRLAEAARLLAGYCAPIAARAAGQDEAGAHAAAGIPVINARTEQQHPCQALADMRRARNRPAVEQAVLHTLFTGDWGC